MKLYARHFPSGWSGDSSIALGIVLAFGKRLNPRGLPHPHISGVHFGVGYLFGQFHLWIGVDADQMTKPSLKFLRLRKL